MDPSREAFGRLHPASIFDYNQPGQTQDVHPASMYETKLPPKQHKSFIKRIATAVENALLRFVAKLDRILHQPIVGKKIDILKKDIGTLDEKLKTNLQTAKSFLDKNAEEVTEKDYDQLISLTDTSEKQLIKIYDDILKARKINKGNINKTHELALKELAVKIQKDIGMFKNASEQLKASQAGVRLHAEIKPFREKQTQIQESYEQLRSEHGDLLEKITILEKLLETIEKGKPKEKKRNILLEKLLKKGEVPEKIDVTSLKVNLAEMQSQLKKKAAALDEYGVELESLHKEVKPKIAELKSLRKGTKVQKKQKNVTKAAKTKEEARAELFKPIHDQIRKGVPLRSSAIEAEKHAAAKKEIADKYKREKAAQDIAEYDAAVKLVDDPGMTARAEKEAARAKEMMKKGESAIGKLKKSVTGLGEKFPHVKPKERK